MALVEWEVQAGVLLGGPLHSCGVVGRLEAGVSRVWYARGGTGLGVCGNTQQKGALFPYSWPGFEGAKKLSQLDA